MRRRDGSTYGVEGASNSTPLCRAKGLRRRLSVRASSAPEHNSRQSRLVWTSLVAPLRCLFAPAFTLLELAVVLFIIGLVLMLAMPQFGAFQGAELRGEARQLATRSHYLYEEAGAQKVLLRLNFDLDRSTYFVTRLDPFAPKPLFLPEKGPAGGEKLMPADVRVRDVWVEGAGLFRRGIAGCQFYPSGVADAAVIHLLDRHGEVMTLRIDPFNGAAAILAGDLSPAAVMKMSKR